MSYVVLQTTTDTYTA